MKINFLEAREPLTKTISPTEKTAYPMVVNVTSHFEDINTPIDLYTAITQHARKGHCLVKGDLTRPLNNESRRGTTRTDDTTQYICLDWDRHECENIDDELVKMGIGDVSYVLQYSASHGLDQNEGTVSAHIFMLLSAPMPAPTLKGWLMDMNMTHFEDGLRLSRSANTISWPLDITTCQNDKILYIAPPVFEGMVDPMKNRITFIKRKLDRIPVKRLGEKHIGALKQSATKLLNDMRKANGLKSRVAGTSWVGAVEVMNRPDTCTVTGEKDCGDSVRLNLNGGDSWAYIYNKDNFTLVHDFKTDTNYRMKDLLPGYYAHLLNQKADLTSTPTEGGDLILAFRDLATDTYYNGIWNPSQNKLDLHVAKNETRLDHWMKSHGRTLGEFIPIWEMVYEPGQNWVVDEAGHRINTFRPSPYMAVEPNPDGEFPHIEKIIKHMLGVHTPQDHLLYHGFINHLACIMQRKHKPRTAWVAQGIEGTGKGFVFNQIITPLLGAHNVTSVTTATIEDDFNGWLQGVLYVFVDEVDVDDFKEKGRVSSKLRNLITEPTMSLRHMRQTAFSAPNWASFLFSSNKLQPVHIPETDRRYTVGNHQGYKLPLPDKDTVVEELEAFAGYLLAHEADTKAADTIINTVAREKIKKMGVTSIVETCRAITSGDFDALWLTRPDELSVTTTGVISAHMQNSSAYVMLMKDIGMRLINSHEKDWKNYPLTRDEIMVILQYNVGNMPPTPNKFTSLLRHNGIETTQLRKNGMRTYGLPVNWTMTDEVRAELTMIAPPRKLKAVK